MQIKNWQYWFKWSFMKMNWKIQSEAKQRDFVTPLNLFCPKNYTIEMWIQCTIKPHNKYDHINIPIHNKIQMQVSAGLFDLAKIQRFLLICLLFFINVYLNSPTINEALSLFHFYTIKLCFFIRGLPFAKLTASACRLLSFVLIFPDDNCRPLE